MWFSERDWCKILWAGGKNIYFSFFGSIKWMAGYPNRVCSKSCAIENLRRYISTLDFRNFWPADFHKFTSFSYTRTWSINNPTWQHLKLKYFEGIYRCLYLRAQREYYSSIISIPEYFIKYRTLYQRSNKDIYMFFPSTIATCVSRCPWYRLAEIRGFDQG